MPDPHLRSKTVVRTATSADVPAMAAVERDSPLAAHWPESAYLQIFNKDGPARIAVLAQEHKDAPEICGFVIARVAAGECELENLAVARGHQNRGIGSQLVQALAGAARDQSATRIFLEVRESNAAARALYEKCGFAIAGRRASYCVGPIEDAILYALSL